MPLINYNGDFALLSTPLCVLDFYTSWCGPCKTIAPLFENLSKKYPEILFLKIDGDIYLHDEMEKFKITGFPTLIVLKNGKEIHRSLGFTTKTMEILESVIHQNPKIEDIE